MEFFSPGTGERIPGEMEDAVVVAAGKWEKFNKRFWK